MDGFAPLLSECGIAITKQIDSSTDPLQTRAGILLASPGIALDEQKRGKTIRQFATPCSRAGVHGLARPTSSADYQTVCGRSLPPSPLLQQPSSRPDRVASCVYLPEISWRSSIRPPVSPGVVYHPLHAAEALGTHGRRCVGHRDYDSLKSPKKKVSNLKG